MKGEEEFNLIQNSIEQIYNSKIKKINLIYKASKDGGNPSDFHKKCDGIKNTLVLYESKGNRRFGGFASESWEKESFNKPDKNCFIFSLDNKEIFSIKDTKYFELGCDINTGPCFVHNGIYCISILGNIFQDKSLSTCESLHPSIFGGNKNILSEDGHFIHIFAKEIEVFQIIF